MTTKKDPSTLIIADIPSLEEHGHTLRRWTYAPRGLLLISGGIGSGKTTSAYVSMVEIATRSDVQVASIESEIGLSLKGVHQCTVSKDDVHGARVVFEQLIEQGFDVIFIATHPSLWGLARRASANHLIMVQVEALSIQDAQSIFEELAGGKIHDDLVGVLWQEMRVPSQVGGYRVHYQSVSGSLGQ